MRVVLLSPGSGGSFYCENCLRDSALVRALQAAGHAVRRVPMYLPLLPDEPGFRSAREVFFGGINVFLQQKSALFRHTPRWVDRLFDAPRLLRQVAGLAGMTRASDLGEMTVSMLRGLRGRQAKEVRRLTAALATERPEAVLLSNALLTGLAPGLKEALEVAVGCLLQDEDTWVEAMSEPWRGQCWELMAEDARSVDAFVAVSRYYADAVAPRLRVPPSRLHVVRIGICLEGYGPGERPNPPVVGYLGRAGCGLGLRTLAEAFVALARDARCREVRLRVAGGSTQDDAPLLADVRRHLDAAGVGDRVEFLANLTRADRQAFLRSITLLCVPAEHPPAFGMSLLEALACAVPVVQPREGGFEEIVEIAGGGVLYAPNTAHALAGTLAAVLADPAGLQRLGEQGREGVRRHFSAERMAEDMLKVLDELVAGRPGSGRQEGASV